MDKKLIVETDRFQIEWHSNLAKTNAALLQAVHELHAIASERDAQTAIAQADRIIRERMEAHHKKFVGVIPEVLTLVMPPEIVALKTALLELKQNASTHYKQVPTASGFQFVRFVDRWEVDTASLETYCERFYQFADPFKLEVATTIADALNRLPIAYDNIKVNAFKTIATHFDVKTGKAIPDKAFIKN